MTSRPHDPDHSPLPAPAHAADHADRTAPPRPLEFKGVPVPYVAAWSGEASTDIAAPYLISRTNLFNGQVQVRYSDERPEDRDERGLLWHRVALTDPGWE